jgi:ElaB/YqjD/DUF883 family membrane-anchored ribosome-binding protein
MINHLRNEPDPARQAERTCRRRGLLLEADWQDRAKQAATRAGNFIAAHPVASLGAAVALGLAVGWWVKRR